MDAKHAKPRVRKVPVQPLDNSEAALEEVIEASLHPDRAHHDELGHTTPDDRPEPSPREQPAGPIDVAHVDE